MQDRLTHDEDGTIDEIVLTNANIHLEHLGDDNYMLIAENSNAHFHLRVSQAQPYEMIINDKEQPAGTDWWAAQSDLTLPQQN